MSDIAHTEEVICLIMGAMIINKTSDVLKETMILACYVFSPLAQSLLNIFMDRRLKPFFRPDGSVGRMKYTVASHDTNVAKEKNENICRPADRR